MMSVGLAAVLDSADGQSPPSVGRDCCHALATFAKFLAPANLPRPAAAAQPRPSAKAAKP